MRKSRLRVTRRKHDYELDPVGLRNRRLIESYKVAYPSARCVSCGQTGFWLRPRPGVPGDSEVLEDYEPVCEFCLEGRVVGSGEVVAETEDLLPRCRSCGVKPVKKGRPLCFSCWREEKRSG